MRTRSGAVCHTPPCRGNRNHNSLASYLSYILLLILIGSVHFCSFIISIWRFLICVTLVYIVFLHCTSVQHTLVQYDLFGEQLDCKGLTWTLSFLSTLIFDWWKEPVTSIMFSLFCMGKVQCQLIVHGKSFHIHLYCIVQYTEYSTIRSYSVFFSIKHSQSQYSLNCARVDLLLFS